MHKRWTPGAIWGTAILLMLSAGVLTAQQTEPYTDTTDLTDYTKAILRSISKITKSDSLPIFFQFYDTLYQPAPGVLCVVQTKNDSLELLSDENGEMLYWVPRKDRSKIRFHVYSHQPVHTCFPLTGSGYSESGNLGLMGSFRVFLKILWASRHAPLLISYGMPELKEEGIRVLYPEEYNVEARQVLDEVKLGKAVIDSTLHMRLKPLKVVLKKETSIFELHVGGGWWTTPEIDSGYVFGTIPHEWVESSLGSIYNVDGRWIADGLANYVAFTICKLYYPEELSSLHSVDWPGYDPDKTYDLRTWKEAQIINLRGGRSVDVFGYLLAPYFWAKAVEKSGNPELIPQFLEAYRVSEDKSSDTAIAILSRLSGLDIEAEMVITGKEFRENVRRYWPEPPSSSVDESEKE